ncbi:hypothetical protein DM02DRAFT_650995 [Periconia macrospinosa]|uniref:Uncharacterized protein n=1 Tax=Periconia macrospinosa TaxID=97972 RepID=A0A2V1E706_9PLEO|nr:hypothetical protein DM02DRAFT_650995 [Periconia macrospinosa]
MPRQPTQHTIDPGGHRSTSAVRQRERRNAQGVRLDQFPLVLPNPANTGRGDGPIRLQIERFTRTGNSFGRITHANGNTGRGHGQIPLQGQTRPLVERVNRTDNPITHANGNTGRGHGQIPQGQTASLVDRVNRTDNPFDRITHANTGRGHGQIPQGQTGPLVERVNRTDNPFDRVTHANGNAGVPGTAPRRVVSETEASPINPTPLGQVRQPRLSGRITGDSTVGQEQAIPVRPPSQPNRSASTTPSSYVISSDPPSRRNAANGTMGSITTRSISARPIRFVNGMEPKFDNHGNNYRGKDPVKRAVSNPILRSVLAGRPAPRIRKNADRPVLRMGLHKADAKRFEDCELEDSEQEDTPESPSARDPQA